MPTAQAVALARLFGFVVSLGGAGLFAVYPGAGLILIISGVVVLIATLLYALYWHWKTIRARALRLGTAQLALLIGLAGAWLFATAALAATGWTDAAEVEITLFSSHRAGLQKRKFPLRVAFFQNTIDRQCKDLSVD